MSVVGISFGNSSSDFLSFFLSRSDEESLKEDEDYGGEVWGELKRN